jgi:hypothetical protein
MPSRIIDPVTSIAPQSLTVAGAAPALHRFPNYPAEVFGTAPRMIKSHHDS